MGPTCASGWLRTGSSKRCSRYHIIGIAVPPSPDWRYRERLLLTRAQQRVAGVHPRGGENHRGEAPGLCHGGRDVRRHGGCSECRRRNSPRSSNGTPKWPIQHVRQTVVPNGPKQARKSARNGPFSAHGPPLTPNRALVTHSAPKKLRRNQGIDKLIWNGKPYRALRLGAQPYC